MAAAIQFAQLAAVAFTSAVIPGRSESDEPGIHSHRRKKSASTARVLSHQQAVVVMDPGLAPLCFAPRDDE